MMTQELKKRFRKLIREKYENSHAKTFEAQKDMWRILGLIDSVMDTVSVEDIVTPDEAQEAIVIRSLMGDLRYLELDKEKNYPIKRPDGSTVVIKVVCKKQ